MALGGAGYFHNNYWHQQYWHEDYWIENAVEASSSGLPWYRWFF